jgi:hypothetical protein
MTLNFNISGAALVELVRSMVLEDRADHAVSALRMVLGPDDQPLSFDTCYAILAGKMTLTGTAEKGLLLVKEPPAVHAAVREAQMAIYAGRFEVKGEWYRIYARITGGMRRVDADWAMAQMVPPKGWRGAEGVGLLWEGPPRASQRYSAPYEEPRWVRWRALYYAHDPANDLLLRTGMMVSTDDFRLAERSTAPPRWLLPDRPLPASEHPWSVYTALQTAHLEVINTATFMRWDDRVAHVKRAAEAALQAAKMLGAGGGGDAADATDPDTERVMQKTEVLTKFFREEPDAAATFVQIEDIRRRVREQAGPMDQGPSDAFGGWITLRSEGEDPDVYRVPWAPFLAWVHEVAHRSGMETAPLPERLPWPTCSPSGIKLAGDIAVHTDWILGAKQVMASGKPCDRDCTITGDYRMPLSNTDGLMALAHERSYRMRYDDYVRHGAPPADVLVPGPSVTGHVAHPTEDCTLPPGTIAVLPDASERWAMVAMTAAAIVVEAGGALAHVVSVARGRGCLVLRLPSARQVYLHGDRVTLQGNP